MCTESTCDCPKTQITCWKCTGEKKIHIGTTLFTCPICHGLGYQTFIDKET